LTYKIGSTFSVEARSWFKLADSIFWIYPMVPLEVNPGIIKILDAGLRRHDMVGGFPTCPFGNEVFWPIRG